MGLGPSWEVHGAPSGDYRITVRAAGEAWPDGASYEETRAMRSWLEQIVFFSTPYTLGALDPHVVQSLLDIHEAVAPMSRHPSAEALLRTRYPGELLRALGRELVIALEQGQLRV